jgi:protocatechuate 3,4-dioxygenase beta subunit
MTTMIKAAAVVAAVALAGLWWQGRGASAPAAAARGDEAAVLEQRDAPLVPAGAEPAAGEEVAAAPALGRRAAAPAAAPITESSVAATRIQRGRLVDLSGAPLEGVVVRLLARHAAVPSIAVPLEHGAAHEALPHGHPAVGPPAGAPAPDAPADPERLGAARTDGDGVFAIELPASSAERAPIPGMPAHGTPRGYALDDARLMLVLVTADAAGAPLLLAAPRTTLGGTVFDPDGGPLRDAEVQLAVLDTLLRSLGLPYAINLQLPAWTTRTDATGRFRFEGVLGGEHTLISVPWGVHSGAVLTPPAHDDLWLELHLRVRDDVLRVVGIVLDASGSPVPGSAVALGDEIDESDADGRFELAWNTAHERSFAEVLAQGFRPRPMPQSHVAAYARGLGVARVELTRELAAEPVVLRLSGAPLAIDGRVVDDRGEPLERVQVWMTDPTHFGSRRETIGAALILHPLSLEEMQVGKRSAVTDANGRFRLEGLLDRSYSVQAFDPRTHSFGPGWTIAAGATGVELALATESSATRVAGRLVSRGGRPLAGVGVHPVRRADRPELEWPPLQGAGRETTDSDGRFEFPELAAEGTRLTVFGGPELGYLVEHYALADFPDPERIEIVLPLSCELQVVLSDPATADAARALDADGNALSVIESHGTFTMMPDVVRIVAGRSAVVSVSELARELVLLRGGAEVVRLPLRVDPDRRTTVEY